MTRRQAFSRLFGLGALGVGAAAATPSREIVATRVAAFSAGDVLTLRRMNEIQRAITELQDVLAQGIELKFTT